MNIRNSTHRNATWTQALLASALVLVFAAACTTAPKSGVDRSELKRASDTAMRDARAGHPRFDAIVRSAPGYAVFPNVRKGGAVVGGAYGRGIVYQNGMQVGYTDLSQASIGLQLGGQAYTEILIFETYEALDEFRRGNYEFNAQATAVALKSGEGTNAQFENGVAVFTIDEAGLMFEAAIGGQKFTYEAFAAR